MCQVREGREGKRRVMDEGQEKKIKCKCVREKSVRASERERE